MLGDAHSDATVSQIPNFLLEDEKEEQYEAELSHPDSDDSKSLIMDISVRVPAGPGRLGAMSVYVTHLSLHLLLSVLGSMRVQTLCRPGSSKYFPGNSGTVASRPRNDLCEKRGNSSPIILSHRQGFARVFS